jgi:hypothetical protein
VRRLNKFYRGTIGKYLHCLLAGREIGPFGEPVEKPALHYRITSTGSTLMPQLHFHFVKGGSGVCARAVSERTLVCSVNREDNVDDLVGPARFSGGQDYFRPGKFVFLQGLLLFGYQRLLVFVLRLLYGSLAAFGTEPIF